jgi:ubiquinone/menaquinone biosynthesis C-methylase UbiE
MTATPDWNSFGRTNAAQRWRRQSGAMGREMTETIVAAARIEPGMRVLDVACGTGEPAISIATQLAGTGEVVGIDISEEPLKIAEQRARERQLPNISFRQGDVHSLPFAAASFDRITCRLGVMFFSDMPQAAREMRRVLRPGGQATFIAWGPMEQPYFEATIGTILRTLPGMPVPATGAAMFKFSQPGTLPAVLHAAGFTEIDESFPTIGWTWPGPPEEVWEYFKQVTVPFRPLLDSVPESRWPEVDAAVLAAMRRYCDGGTVLFTATICLVSAD